MFNNLFGRKKTQAQKAAKPPGGGGGGGGGARKAPSAADTIGGMRDTLENMEKRQAHLAKKVENELKMAKAKSKAKDKKGALFCLKRKAMYEKEIAKLDGSRLTIEQQIMTLEAATVNIETVGAMKQGADMMTNMHKQVKVDDVENLQEQLEELQQDAEEISNALGQPMGAAAMMDDDDLMAELDELEAEDLDRELLGEGAAPVAAPAAAAPGIIGAATLPSMPDAPTAEPEAPAADAEEEAALKALEAEMAM